MSGILKGKSWGGAGARALFICRRPHPLSKVGDSVVLVGTPCQSQTDKISISTFTWRRLGSKTTELRINNSCLHPQRPSCLFLNWQKDFWHHWRRFFPSMQLLMFKKPITAWYLSLVSFRFFPCLFSPNLAPSLFPFQCATIVSINNLSASWYAKPWGGTNYPACTEGAQFTQSCWIMVAWLWHAPNYLRLPS